MSGAGNKTTLTAEDELGGESTVPQHGGAPVPVTEGDALPATIGRYRVLRKLGAGGMGVVYAAHDPELGRTVAVKLVRERFGGVGAGLRERLRREAQALARLSHPHVVSIHDVGVDGDQLFIVMQYVDGAPLDDWIDARAPGRARIIELYLQAGRGLAAAHAAGLVHRDFKPGNVLVDESGVAKVTDFGLARLSHLAEEPSGSGSGSGDALSDSMTRGDVVGTPAYMAPEQFLGGAITGATDQFGFCVALWEALNGARPFTGKTFEAIRRAVLLGELPPPARVLPRRIVRALRRGLATKAAERFPDMKSLLAELEPPRRWWLAAGAAAGLIGAGAVAAVALGGGATPNPCGGVASAIDKVWTPARRQALSGLGEVVIGRLDDRAATWRTLRIDVCEANRVRRSEDETVATRRMACLDRSLDGLRSALELLAGDPTATRRTRALSIVRSSVDPATCTAAGTLHDRPSVPVPPELRQRLADLETRGAAGDNVYVIAEAAKLGAELEAAGDIDGAARAWFSLALMSNQDVPKKVAREAARKAATLAAQVGDDVLDARVWAAAAERAAGAGEVDGVDEFLTMASAAAVRSGDPSTRMMVEVSRGFVASSRTDYQAAVTICRKVYDDAKATYGVESEAYEGALGCLSNAYYQLERWDDAAAIATERLALRRKLDGPESAGYLDAAETAALVTFWGGDKLGGRAAMADVIAAESRVYGAESLQVMNCWWDLGLAESHDGNFATPEAVAASQRAVDLSIELLPEDDLRRASILATHGDLLNATGDHDGATAAYEQALTIYDRIKNVRMWGAMAYNAADSYRTAGHCDRAQPLLDRLIALAEAGEVSRSLGADSRGLLGGCQFAAGHYDQGIATQAAAIKDLDALGDDVFAAQFRLESAEARIKHGDRAGARALLAEVRTRMLDDGDEMHVAMRAEADRIEKLKP